MAAVTRFMLRVVTNFQSPLVVTRSLIYTPAYVLGSPNFKEARQEFRSTLSDTNGVKKNLIESCQEANGSSWPDEKNMDLLFNLCDTKSDMDFLANLLQAMASEKTPPPNIDEYMAHYFKLCYIHEDIDSANAMFEQLGSKLGSHSHLIYLCLLYNHGMYREIAACYGNLKRTTYSGATVVVAALYKIGSNEAFSQAYELHKSLQLKGRATRILILFAIAQNQLAYANELIDSFERWNRRRNEKFGRKSTPSEERLETNLRLMVFIKSGRIDEALNSLRQRIDQFGHLCLYLEVMELLSKAVRASGNQKLVKKFSQICLELDNHSELIETSLEDFLLEPIEKTSQKKQQS